MRSNYKRLGDYIRQLNTRNVELKDVKLLGVSIQKKFIPSIANTIGTNMATYKLVKKDQFAYGPVTSRNGDKISIALLEDFEEAIISQAYTSFEIVDKNKLLPQYLMMWFRRSEFDRYARFISHGSVREIFSWEDMCDVELPIPPVEEQRKIVKEYNIIVDRIRLNNKLIQKIEDTAQAIYKQWFLDFEFSDKKGKPFKINGEMIYNEVMDKKIPKCWEIVTIEDLSQEIITGKTPSTLDNANFGNDIPFVTIPDMHDKVFAMDTERSLSGKGAESQANKTLPPNSLCVSCIGTAGLVVITSEYCQTNQQINSVICKEDVSIYYAFFSLKALKQKIQEWGSKGSVGINMNKKEFSSLKVILPPTEIMFKFDKIIKPFFKSIKLKQKEQLVLKNALELINNKMSLK